MNCQSGEPNKHWKSRATVSMRIFYEWNLSRSCWNLVLENWLSLLFCEWNVEACINNRSGTQSHVSDLQKSSVKSRHTVALTCDLVEWDFMNEIDSLEGTAAAAIGKATNFRWRILATFTRSQRDWMRILRYWTFQFSFVFIWNFDLHSLGSRRLVFRFFLARKNSRTSAIFIEFVGHISALVEWTEKSLCHYDMSKLSWEEKRILMNES